MSSHPELDESSEVVIHHVIAVKQLGQGPQVEGSQLGTQTPAELPLVVEEEKSV